MSAKLVSLSSVTRDLSHVLTRRRVKKLLSALAVLTGSVTSIDRKVWMSGKVVWSQASKSATANSGTKYRFIPQTYPLLAPQCNLTTSLQTVDINRAVIWQNTTCMQARNSWYPSAYLEWHLQWSDYVNLSWHYPLAENRLLVGHILQCYLLADWHGFSDGQCSDEAVFTGTLRASIVSHAWLNTWVSKQSNSFLLVFTTEILPSTLAFSSR